MNSGQSPFVLDAILNRTPAAVIEGVPVLLDPHLPDTIGIARESAAAVARPDATGLYASAIGVSPPEQEAIVRAAQTEPAELAVIRHLIPATNGRAFRVGQANRVPSFPDFPVRGTGLLLDIGCNWGRWSFAAARAGFTVVGIDPSLGATIAGTRLAKRLGLSNLTFVCGDARSLPFLASSFDVVFSYSVLQHFADEDVATTVKEIRRVLKPGGTTRIQMAHRPGPIGTVHALRHGKPAGFDVRYRSSSQLRSLFAPLGPIGLTTSGVVGLGLEPSLVSEMTAAGRVLTRVGQALKHVPGSRLVADSVWCTS